ncbi:MAG TPA: hypothetical protein VM891_06335 [Amaricoccus sp.]|nr:hypothetical protein [Amaricoccus sp.]
MPTFPEHGRRSWEARRPPRLAGFAQAPLPDATRERAYDRDSHVGTLGRSLDAAPKQGWQVIGMAKDWKLIHPFEKAQQPAPAHVNLR